MPQTPVTKRTKSVCWKWSGEAIPLEDITLDTSLSRLREGNQDDLRARMNKEFRGEGNFPITAGEWNEKSPKKVRDVRDLAQKKLP